MKEAKFYKTKNGSIVAGLFVSESEEMLELKANVTDGAIEKHVPFISFDESKLIVDVGSIEHPMMDAHFIQFIALQSERGLEIVTLKPNEKPHAEFEKAEHGVVYEYCNLHGLWKKEF